MGMFVVGGRCIYAGLRGRSCDIAYNVKVTQTTSLRERGNPDDTPALLIRAITGMSLSAAAAIAVCVALFWLLFWLLCPLLVNPDEIEWVRRNSFAIAGCAVGFAIILACLESLLIATFSAILLAALAHVALLFTTIIPELRKLTTHSGETKHLVFAVVGLAIGVGLGFAASRMPAPDENLTRPAFGWRVLEGALGTLLVTVAGLAIYWVSQQVSEKETHNAPLTAASASCLIFFALLVFPKIPPSASWKSLLVQAFVPAGALGFLGAAAGWVITHPQLHEIKIVNGFGDGLIIGAVLTLAWVFLYWCLQPLCKRRRTAARIALILLVFVAIALLFLAFEHLNRESRWYTVPGFIVGALIGTIVAVLTPGPRIPDESSACGAEPEQQLPPSQHDLHCTG